MDDDYCYLTTTGRRSGRPHRIEIWYARHEATLYLLSGAGRGSDWVRNLEVDPAVTVELRGVAHPATARVLDVEDAEAGRARTLVHDKYAARQHGDLGEWRQRSLPVAIDLADPER